jgi:RNA polymerase sigma-70 factor (ECF subfamily)
MALIDAVTLGKWYDKHAAALTLYARQLLPLGRGEDVVQDVFIRLMSQPQQPENVKAWLYRSVRNASISSLRSRRRSRQREQARAATMPEAFESCPGDLIDARTAGALLAALPRESREVVVLRIWSALTFQEIAGLTDAPVTSVFRRYREGLAAIRKAMVIQCNNSNA